MQNKYKHWSLQQRIDRILNDEDFKLHCQKLRQIEGFDKDFALVEKLSKIDVKNLKCDFSLLNKKFTLEEIKNDVVGFYQTLDKIYPKGINFVQLLTENVKYFTTETDTDNYRSHCCAELDDDGNVYKEIYLKIEGELCDTINIIHEFGHSFSKAFIELKMTKDKRVAEIPTVILDHLSLIYQMIKHSDLKKNYIEFEKYGQVINIGKARECLAGALIIKVMTGEENYESVIAKYGELFKQYPHIIEDWLDRIESFNFYDVMSEKKYLIPQAIALIMKERFKTDPTNTIKQLKEIVAHVHVWTEEKILKYLNISNKEKLIDDYILKFDSRIAKLNKELELQCELDRKL